MGRLENESGCFKISETLHRQTISGEHFSQPPVSSVQFMLYRINKEEYIHVFDIYWNAGTSFSKMFHFY